LICVLAGCGESKHSGSFVIELYPEYAPITVENFLKLTEEGFYDGLTFHRISEGFMAQGGGYGVDEYKFSDNDKKPADTIFGEFANNGFTQNTLTHTKGVISMARLGNSNDSASSEFFIMFDAAEHLDGDYAAFGKVIEGMEIIDKFQEIERVIGFDREISQPVEPLIIKKMTVLD
jgi:cyclophilin family peptidyl-prolyl cis-trans isomerase